jgi:hypothetical protein
MGDRKRNSVVAAGNTECRKPLRAPRHPTTSRIILVAKDARLWKITVGCEAIVFSGFVLAVLS